MCSDRTGPSDTEALQVVSISYRCGDTTSTSGGGGGGAGAGGGGGGGGGAGGGAGSGRAAGGGAGALSAGAAALETELAESGTAVIYDIFFSFNSASIREESLPRLREIADVLMQHPDWRLSVNGHTDNIASDNYNLELSARRAEAVKEALASRHGVDAGRLVTAGYGEAQPRDTNDTLEGRARNRRVELVKE
jgi:outer membrane protein OmpA-like peptidoglycan-associated protein